MELVTVARKLRIESLWHSMEHRERRRVLQRLVLLHKEEIFLLMKVYSQVLPQVVENF